MALLEKETNYYYRIDFDRCAVRGLKVFVTFSAYKSTAERDKEKERVAKWAEFFQNLRESLQTQYTALLAAVEVEGISPEQVLSAEEDGKIDAGKYPVLRLAQDKMNDLAPFEQGIGERLFKYGDNEKPALVIPNDVLEELERLGFDEAWVTDPVLLDGGAEVCAGDYEGESISQEFYYNRLKTVMGETTDC